MPKFTLIAEQLDDGGFSLGETVTHEFNEEYLPDVLLRVELFLRGVGYCPSGTLDFVEDDIQHSTHYFATERNR